MSTHRDILLVEDDEAIADLLRRMLMRAGYTVHIATDGRQALAALAEDIPAVLILDLILPRLSGFTVLDHMHRDQMTVPIIVITATPGHRDSLHYVGIRQVLIKPFLLEELLEAVHTIVGYQHSV